jgi:pyruvate kinase
MRRTKIVVTLGPASSSPEIIRQLINAGMDVARLNFSHATHEEHAQQIAQVRAISKELDAPVTILQDLQGPKIRVGTLPRGEITLVAGDVVSLVPENDFQDQPATIPVDYPHVADEARPKMRVLLADGLFELEIIEVISGEVRCRVILGGELKSRKEFNITKEKKKLQTLTDTKQKEVQ